MRTRRAAFRGVFVPPVSSDNNVGRNLWQTLFLNPCDNYRAVLLQHSCTWKPIMCRCIVMFSKRRHKLGNSRWFCGKIRPMTRRSGTCTHISVPHHPEDLLAAQRTFKSSFIVHKSSSPASQTGSSPHPNPNRLPVMFSPKAGVAKKKKKRDVWALRDSTSDICFVSIVTAAVRERLWKATSQVHSGSSFYLFHYLK